MLVDAGLVLEGGAMKGVYTAGVLDFFLDKDIQFAKIYGVSAGACEAINYAAKQRERGYRVFTDYLHTTDFCSPASMLKTGDYFNVAVAYDLIPNYYDPFDYETFTQYPGEVYAVVTNVKTGKPEYIRLTDMRDTKQMEFLRASASMPLVSRKVWIDGVPYLDGGISDSIPIMHSIKEGNKKNVVVMTKQKGYRRGPAYELPLIKMRYCKYPKVYDVMQCRQFSYNACVDEIERQVAAGETFLLQPKDERDVSRVEKDTKKLRLLYEDGYEDAKNSYEQLKEYLGI